MRLLPKLGPYVKTVRLWPMAAITIYPFIFIDPKARKPREQILAHEKIHHRQQDKFWTWGGIIGLFYWYFLYLLVLPIGWNPFRWKWEYEAFKEGSGYDHEYIVKYLRGFYQLYWMK